MSGPVGVTTARCQEITQFRAQKSVIKLHPLYRGILGGKEGQKITGPRTGDNSFSSLYYPVTGLVPINKGILIYCAWTNSAQWF